MDGHRAIEEFRGHGRRRDHANLPGRLLFQAGYATHDEVKKFIRLFGEYVIPHFRAKEGP